MKQHRGVVYARNGVLAASQPLAVSAGLQMLMEGGSFADAALATSAVLCVTEPHNSHLGGDGFAIIYEAKTGSVTALNGSGKAPVTARIDKFPGGIPLRGTAAAAVPGLPHLWFAMHDRWGRLSRERCLAAAINYARDGYPVGSRTAGAFQGSTELWQTFPETLQTLTGMSTPPQAGTLLHQPELASTLTTLANQGSDGFYRGTIAEAIAAACAATHGFIGLEDLAAHRTQISEPISTSYRDVVVHGQPPVSQGHILLQQLNMIENFDVCKMGHNSADLIHVMTEAKKLAFADRSRYLGDPSFIDVPLAHLLSKKYGSKRAAGIQLNRAMDVAAPGEVPHDTTYFCVADNEGNAVSFIQSVFWGYGSAVTIPGTGILLNNRMTSFSLEPSHPNVLMPGKRPVHTLNTWLITREENGRPMLAAVGGTPGADYQVQTNLQVISNVVDFGMNPQEAIEAPRWQHGESVSTRSNVEALMVEDRISPDVIGELRQRGHTVQLLPAYGHGSTVQCIVRPRGGDYYTAGSDLRADGHAAGF